MFVTRSGQPWFSVSELARRLNQAYTFDHDAAVWSFSEIPVTRNHLVGQRLAPDFELADLSGKPIKLSAYKDKKVILLTWASW
ncbi:MAG: redoxin domain-containing protein [Halieaceae bacterium]|nr:redoxin domain-containing protein [Halieaceae bacterium]